MKNKTKFTKMFKKLPEEARRSLVLNAYGGKPMSLNVIYWEVKADTELGKKCLIELGYEKDNYSKKQNKMVFTSSRKLNNKEKKYE